MKRANSDKSQNLKNEPSSDLLIRLGKNALLTLNNIQAYSKNWIPMLNLLAAGISFSELSEFVNHAGTSSSLAKAMQKASNLNDNPLIERVHSEKPSVIVKEKEKIAAEDFLISHTKESKAHRLVTKESISSLYIEYVGTVDDPLHQDTFTEVYRHLRILKDKHCEYSIYTCPKCQDDFPAAEALVRKLESEGQQQSEDYKEALRIYQHLEEHKSKSTIQTNYFAKLWDEPPESCLIVAEDAGKRFVLDGKGCAHIMMTRHMTKEKGKNNNNNNNNNNSKKLSLSSLLLLIYFRNI